MVGDPRQDHRQGFAFSGYYLAENFFQSLSLGAYIFKDTGGIVARGGIVCFYVYKT